MKFWADLISVVFKCISASKHFENLNLKVKVDSWSNQTSRHHCVQYSVLGNRVCIAWSRQAQSNGKCQHYYRFWGNSQPVSDCVRGHFLPMSMLINIDYTLSVLFVAASAVDEAVSRCSTGNGDEVAIVSERKSSWGRLIFMFEWSGLWNMKPNDLCLAMERRQRRPCWVGRAVRSCCKNVIIVCSKILSCYLGRNLCDDKKAYFYIFSL